MASRAWARAVCLVPFVLTIVVAQPAQAAAPVPAARAAAPPHMVTYNNGGLAREVFGYAYSGSLGDPTYGYTSWNFDLLSTVAFFAIHVNNQGVLYADSDWNVWNSSTLAALVSTAHAHGVKVVVTIKASGADLCGALYGANVTASQIVPQVQQKGIDGINIDYEGQLATCPNPNAGGTNYTNQALMTNLAKVLRGALDAAKPGYYLSIATYSGSAAGNDGFFNIPDLNQYVDSFFVMAYDMDYSNQRLAPLQNCSSFCMAPVSPLANYYWNDTTSMAQYSALVGPGKTILGQPYYGRVSCVASPVAHATATGTVQAATYLDAVAAISSTDVAAGSYTIHRDADDPTGQDRWDTWYDNAYGCWREMYWSDVTTLATRYDLVNQDNLRGVGLWTLSYGGGAAELWRLIQTKFVECTNTAATENVPSPQLSGTAVQVTASTSFCANPRYEFWIRQPGGSWSVVQPYSTNATFSWNTLGKPPGAYWFSVWARDANSPGQWGSAPNTYDSYAAFEYDLTTAPCTAVTAAAAPASPQLMSTSVTVTASATSCPKPNYQFWLRSPGSATWRIVQAYSPNATFTWNTAGHAPGDYGVAVWARDTSSLGTGASSLGSWDAMTWFTYTLTTQPCSGVTATFAPASPQLSATPVALTAAAAGCSTPYYEFWELAPGASTWKLAQAYSTNATFNWSTAGSAPGVYRFSVWTRDLTSLGKAGNVLGTWDAYTAAQYTLTSQPCSAVSATGAPPGTAAAGTSVTITGAATGCPAAQYEFWMLAPGSSTWKLVQGYSTNATFTWTTSAGSAKGTYHFSIWARDTSSTGTSGNVLGTWDTYTALAYTLS